MCTEQTKTPHRHAELIKAWADGAKIQQQVGNCWHDIPGTPGWSTQCDYRIKPEPKPDVTIIGNLDIFNGKLCASSYPYITYSNQIQAVFDGETGKLKSVEIVK